MRARLPSPWLSCLTLLCVCPPTFAQTVDFNRDIRPILSDNCYYCHGHDKTVRKGDPPLRLDIKDGIFGERDGTFPVVPGKPEDSVLYMRITSDDPDYKMPHKESNKHLAPKQIDTFKRWIEQGAKWKDHWSYEPPVKTQVENKRDGSPYSSFVRSDIDRFVLATLADRKLRPAKEADKITLVRRLYFDLVGLPPSPKQVDAFVNDPSPNAYENLVDQLLANPHYGERMAVFWLDLVRYADTIGYHSDNNREVYPYRDWVINAFNSNQPFDQFTTDQIAGDLLPSATIQQKIASAYNRLLETTEEGGAQPKEYEAKSAADRVRNIGSAFLGSTIACCQCHDHKFDPFMQKDFYQMAAFFADIKEPPIGKLAPELLIPKDYKQAAEIQSFQEKVTGLRRTLNTPTPQLAAAQLEWEEKVKGTNSISWTPLVPNVVISKNDATLRVGKGGIITATGENPAVDTYTVTARTKVKGITAIRLEAMTDKPLVRKGPGRSHNGNFVLSGFTAALGATPAPFTPQWRGAESPGPAPSPILLQNATASHDQGDGFTAAASIDPKKPEPKKGWAVVDRIGEPHYAVFEITPDSERHGHFSDHEPTTLTFTLEQNWGEQHTLGRFRLSVTTDPRPVKAEKQPPRNIQDIVAIDSEERIPDARAALAAYYRSISPILDPMRKELAKEEKAQAELLALVPKTLTSISDNPRTVRVLNRGDWMDEKGEVVQPNIPAFLRETAPWKKDWRGASSRLTRLDLANWISSKQNPLTARVFVNRLWKMFYGQGISKSLDDLGSQGEWPTHPELLDWLSCEFMDSGWNVKQMVRLMVTSGTYRQASTTAKEIAQQDPYNKYLERQATFRLDAEFLRDNALAVSGLLTPAIGGPSVKPYQPEAYWDFLNFPRRTYEQDKGEAQYRRGLYTHWQRTFLHPSLANFDAPPREECVAQRTQSNTPQQALTLLNDPTYVEAARVFAARIIKEGGPTTFERLTWAFRQALSREPRPQELPVLSELLGKHRGQFATTRPSAEQFVSIGQAAPSKDADPAELAAWTSVARTILNLHETITRN